MSSWGNFASGGGSHLEGDAEAQGSDDELEAQGSDDELEAQGADDTVEDASEEPGDPSSTALSVVASGWPATAPAKELLRTLNALVETLNSERKLYMAAQEDRRAAEIDNARLQAQIEAEQKLRRRVEDELEELRADLKERRRRAEEELDRISRKTEGWPEVVRPAAQPSTPGQGDPVTSSPREAVEVVLTAGKALAEEEERRRRAEEELDQVRQDAAARRDRLSEELQRLRDMGQSEESRRRVKDELERLLGEPITQDRPAEFPGAVEDRAPQAQPAQPQHQASPQPMPQQPPLPRESPLPPGWRYASDLPPRRSRFRVRWGRRPPESI